MLNSFFLIGSFASKMPLRQFRLLLGILDARDGHGVAALLVGLHYSKKECFCQVKFRVSLWKSAVRSRNISWNIPLSCAQMPDPHDGTCAENDACHSDGPRIR